MKNVKRWTIDMDKNVLYMTAGFEIIKDEKLKKVYMLKLIQKFNDFEIIEEVKVNDFQKIFWLMKNGESILISSILKNEVNEVLFIKTKNPISDFKSMKEQAISKMRS